MKIDRQYKNVIEHFLEKYMKFNMQCKSRWKHIFAPKFIYFYFIIIREYVWLNMIVFKKVYEYSIVCKG